MRKYNFSANVMNVFSEMDTNYDEVKNLMFDLAMGNEIFDGERVVARAEAETKLRTVCKKIFGE